MLLVLAGGGQVNEMRYCLTFYLLGLFLIKKLNHVL